MDDKTPCDTSDFSSMLKRHSDRAYNFAFRLAGNESDARDLVQEAFSHALKNFHRYDPNRPFEPWLNRILKNIFLDAKRKYEYKHTISLDLPSPIEDVPWEHIIPGDEDTPEEQAEERETHAMVQKALDSLPLPYKTAVVLCDVEGYSYDYISQVMECPIGTVRSRIHQGRLLLKKAFEKLQLGPEKVAK